MKTDWQEIVPWSMLNLVSQSCVVSSYFMSRTRSFKKGGTVTHAVHPGSPRWDLTVPQFLATHVPASCSSDASSPGAAMRLWYLFTETKLWMDLDGRNKMQHTKSQA